MEILIELERDRKKRNYSISIIKKGNDRTPAEDPKLRVLIRCQRFVWIDKLSNGQLESKAIIDMPIDDPSNNAEILMSSTNSFKCNN